MSDEDDRSKESRERQTVADLLHQHTSGAKRRRGNVGSAVVVHDDADGDVQCCHDELA